jgi:hypothetical protein
MNIQKSVTFLYANNEQAENYIRKTIAFTIQKHEINLGATLTKEVKELYNENYKILMKEIKEVTRTPRDIKASYPHGIAELI